jgi:hypothetical protein
LASLRLPKALLLADSDFAADLELEAVWRVYFETLEIDLVYWNKVKFFIEY